MLLLDDVFNQSVIDAKLKINQLVDRIMQAFDNPVGRAMLSRCLDLQLIDIDGS